jgi:hypothetical protein
VPTAAFNIRLRTYGGDAVAQPIIPPSVRLRYEGSPVKQCYLCGSLLVRGNNMTRDHIPPACIFPPGKPRNLITVPCCLSCNQEYKQLDQKMRNQIAVLAGGRSSDVSRVAGNDILRSFKLSMELVLYRLAWKNGHKLSSTAPSSKVWWR